MAEDTRPRILVAIHEAIRSTQVEQVLLGIEEEGIPFELLTRSDLSPLTLAHEASVASRLGVGIGISLDYIVITTEKLPEGSPYIAAALNHTPALDRALGANAARIVKRMPLADLASCA